MTPAPIDFRPGSIRNAQALRRLDRCVWADAPRTIDARQILAKLPAAIAAVVILALVYAALPNTSATPLAEPTAFDNSRTGGAVAAVRNGDVR